MKRSPMPARTQPLPRRRLSPVSKKRRRDLARHNWSGIPPEVRDEVRARSGGHCEVKHPGCTGTAAHMHHRLPRSGGGEHTAENLLHLCPTGHGYVHTHPALAYEHRWLIRRGTR